MRNLRFLLCGALIAACGGAAVPAPEPVALPDDEQVEPTPVEPEEDPVAEGPREPAPPRAEVEPPAAELTWPEEEYRAKRPTVGKARALVQPKITRFKLANGVQVFLVEKHDLPKVSVDLTFDGGSSNNPAGKEGLSSLCMGLLDDGTVELEKVAFEEALADIASNVSAYSGGEQQGVSMSTLTRNLDATLDLWTATLLRPGMRDVDHQRNVKNTIAGIQQAKGAPGSVGGRLFGSIFYGVDHPMGRFATETTVAAVTVDDCKAYVKDWLAPGGAKLFVVGDITQAQIKEKIGGRLKDWKGKPKASAKVGAAKPRAGRIFFVDVPNAPQSQIYLVHAGPQRKAKDYFATEIAMAVLGGSFTSRINMNIRESKGYAYGARGGVSYTRSLGTFTAGASVRTDSTKDSLIEIVKEISTMISTDVTDEELNREKEGAILSLPAQFATGSGVLGSFRALDYFGLPLDYYKSYVKNVQAVTKAAVRKAAKTHLKPGQLQILVVGDAKAVLPMLKELIEAKTFGEGELVVLDVDGNVVPQK